MKGNNGRLSWSYELLKTLPAGAKPHSNCYRYVKADPVNGFPGGIINFGWGHTVATSESTCYVPSVGRVLPIVAAATHTLLWTCYRMATDWQRLRARIADKVQEENDFIDRLMRQAGGNEWALSSRFSPRDQYIQGG
jgi:hypothetical protein